MSAPIFFPGGFTVLMAVYRGDNAELFERAVQSVFANTLRPDAYLLVVDGPIPTALDAIIQRYQAEFNIQVLSLPVNRGLSHALNAGLEQVSTEWVVRADADDINLPDRFERLAYAVASPEAPDLIGGAIVEVDRDGNVLATRRTPLSHLEIVQYARYRNPFNHMTVAYRCSLVRRCGGYPHIHLREDYALWAMLLFQGATALNLPDVLVHATAGRDFNLRRGGWRYAWGELALQRHLVKCRLKPPFFALLHGLMRGTVFILPPFLRGAVYKKILRSSR
jgi:glycosyltransferase involved in cell wall biosynthesis